MKNTSYKTIVFAVALLITNSLYAVGPGSDSMTKYNLRIGNCIVDSLTVKWKLDSLMGEATVSGSYKYEADCKLPYSTKIYLKVSDGPSFFGFVKLAPVVPKPNRGYGYNVTGSPNWNNALCGSGDQDHRCHDSSSAKALWKQGSVTDFDIRW